MAAHPSHEGRRVARLHEHRPRPRELANQPLPSTHIRDDAARRRALQDVTAVPRHEVAIVNDILLALLQLFRPAPLAPNRTHTEPENTHPSE